MPDPKPLPPDAVRLDAFFADQTAWRAELLALRAILTECGLTETFKWSSPVYTAHGGNVAIIWGFRDRAAIGFFKGVLMADPERLLQPPGDNSRSSRIINFTDLAQIRAAAPILRAYIAEAARIEEQGQKVDLPKDDLDYPEELIRRLDGDADFRAAFEIADAGPPPQLGAAFRNRQAGGHAAGADRQGGAEDPGGQGLQRPISPPNR